MTVHTLILRQSQQTYHPSSGRRRGASLDSKKALSPTFSFHLVQRWVDLEKSPALPSQLLGAEFPTSYNMQPSQLLSRSFEKCQDRLLYLLSSLSLCLNCTDCFSFHPFHFLLLKTWIIHLPVFFTGGVMVSCCPQPLLFVDVYFIISFQRSDDVIQLRYLLSMMWKMLYN